MADIIATGEKVNPRRSTRISSRPQVEGQEKKSRVGSKRNTMAEDEPTAELDKKRPSKKVLQAKGSEALEPDSAEPDEAHVIDRIDIGDSLPSLTLKNEKDEDVDIATLASEKGVILFLIPKADTPGCTTQACGFLDVYPDFRSLNFDVYCLSADAPGSQSKWQTKKHLPYPLISDRKRLLISALGAGEGGRTKRSHFIFDKGGKLVDKKIPVKPHDSPKLALEFVKSLNGNQS